MQLNMVTPMDIGLERHDGIDDSDMFDLGEMEGAPRTANGLAFEGDGSDEEDEDDSDLSDTERKTRKLESSLDALYDQYQQNKLERDAKHKVKEARRKRDAIEGGEWGGIKQGGDSEEEEESEEEFDPAPKPSDDEDSDDELEEEANGMTVDSDAGRGKAASKLVTDLSNLDKRLPDKGRQAAMWFDQPVFKTMPGFEQLLNGDSNDVEEESVDNNEVSHDWSGIESEAEEESASEVLDEEVRLFFRSDHHDGQLIRNANRRTRNQMTTSRAPYQRSERSLTSRTRRI
jgi:AdoMet-dependent rRNA methyltransferase SPB1